MPQNAAGRITEPAVCVPKASGAILSATAAAEPLDEPPGVCAGLRGLAVLPGVKQANSVVTVFPNTIAPAARASATQAASAPGRWRAKTPEPYPVGMSAVSIKSLTAIGIPCSGPLGADASQRRAASSAASGSRYCQ